MTHTLSIEHTLCIHYVQYSIIHVCFMYTIKLTILHYLSYMNFLCGIDYSNKFLLLRCKGLDFAYFFIIYSTK